MDQLTLSNGVSIPKMGMGTWYMGENPSKADEEIKSLRLGVGVGYYLDRYSGDVWGWRF